MAMSFNFHISTKYLWREANIKIFAKLLKEITNVQLSIEGDFRPIKFWEMEYIVDIPIERLNSNAICICQRNDDPTTMFIELVGYLKPTTIYLDPSPPCCGEAGLLQFIEEDLDIVCNWPIKFIYLGLFGYPEKPPLDLMNKLLEIQTLDIIYVEHECREETKILCQQKNIMIFPAIDSPPFFP